MNSRERVFAAINHQEPDRVPIDFGATSQTGIHAIAYTKLKEYLGIKRGHTRINDPILQLGEPEEEVLDYFRGADSRWVLNRKWPAEVKKHVTELLEIFAPGGGYVWNTVHNILPDVPPENIVAAIEGVHEFNDKRSDIII